MSTRPAPTATKWLVAALLVLQVGLGALQSRPVALARALPAPPSVPILRLASFGEPLALGQLITLWLQAFDNQPGISIPYLALDYARVEQWLDSLSDLDRETIYPLMMATQLYGQIPDLEKDRKMLEFVHRRFLQEPDLRWRWMAHAAIMAKHRLKDLPLAHRYAEDLASHVTSPAVPGWARQMRIFLLEDMGEGEAAKILLGGLLASGEIKDEHERHFLLERFNALQQGEISSKSSSSRPK